MKRLLITLLITVFCFSNVSAYATQTEHTSTGISNEIIYVSDNVYIEISTEEETLTAYSFSRASSQTKTVSKTASINNDGTTVAKFKLTGTFTYNGSSSSCTSTSYSTTIYDDSWKFTSSSSSKSGNTATGKFTIKDYFLFVSTQTISKTITLTCDANGNVS